MKLGVLSDTHSLPVPVSVLEELKKTDLIIHAGDFCERADYEVLKKIRDVKGVQGNMDGAEIRKLFPVRQIIECEGVRIGLFHGEGSPLGIAERVRQQFAKDRVDVIIFGHSHQPLNETIDGVLCFNPGSPNDMVRAPYRSFGILEIKDRKVKAKIIKVDHER